MDKITIIFAIEFLAIKGLKIIIPASVKIEAKRERVAKNEVQRLRNMARAQKVKIPGSQGLAPPPAGKGGPEGPRDGSDEDYPKVGVLPGEAVCDEAPPSARKVATPGSAATEGLAYAISGIDITC